MVRSNHKVGLGEFGRFSDPALLILISLSEGPRHGYGITEDIATFANIRFGPGSLYGAIARLESKGLIEAMKSEERRNPYRLTSLGERALRAKVASMRTVTRIAQRRLVTA